MSFFSAVMVVLVWIATVTGAYLSGRKHESESAWNGGSMAERDRKGHPRPDPMERIANAAEWCAWQLLGINRAAQIMAQRALGQMSAEEEAKAARDIAAMADSLDASTTQLQAAMDAANTPRP